MLCMSFFMFRPRPRSTLFPYTTLFRSDERRQRGVGGLALGFGGVALALFLRLAFGGGVFFLRGGLALVQLGRGADRKSTRLNSSHMSISYAVFCLKKKKKKYKEDWTVR